MRFWSLALYLCLCLLFAAPAHSQAVYDGSLMRQEAVLAAPKAGTLTGSLSAFDTGIQDLATGSLSYTLPLDFRSERGPLLAKIAPSYSIQQGLSEWGLGWQMNLAIKRTRLEGHINYRDDLFSSPWGLLAAGADQHWYPEGLKSRVRVWISAKQARVYGAEGETYFFQEAQETPLGTYAYYLTEVRSATGRRTLLSYETLKNVVYLKSVRYGGQGENLPYSVDFIYEELPPSKQWISFKSKFSQVHDRLVKRIIHKLTLPSREETLWTYEINHSLDALSPLHFLSSVSKVYPSGSREPAIKFSYQGFEAGKISYETTQRLGPIAERGLDPKNLSFYDYNDDGLLDIETAADHRLYLQGPEGFSLHTQFERREQSVCLGAESSLNRARLVLRLEGLGSDPSVLHSDRRGKFTICDLNGRIKTEESFGFIPEFHRNALLVDLNGDHKPDLYHMTASGYAVYANRSGPQGIQFVLEKSENHKPVPSLSSLWSSDINGDGLPDIAVIGGSTVKVYMGKGDFEFTPTFLNLPIERENGEPFDPSTYTPTFVDLNQDGLADLLFTEGKSLFTFINSGRSFRRLPHESFEMLDTEGAVFTQNIMGSGEQLIFRSGSGGVRVARLNKAGTNLLQSVDDGKGNLLRLSYDFHVGPGNRFSVDKVLRTFSIYRSMEGELSTRFSYEEPYYRAGTSQRLAFGRVTLQDSLGEETAEYDHRDFASVLRSSTERYFSAPAIVLKKRWSYQPGTFRGLPLLERSKEFAYFYDTRSGQATEPQTKEWLRRSAEGCEEKVLIGNSHGSYELSQNYFKAAGFDAHLLCLPETMKIGPLDGFEYTSELSYNDRLLIRSFVLHGGQESQTLQALAYDRFDRLEKLVAANGSVKTYSYLDESDTLLSVLDGNGVEVRQDGLNDRDLFTAWSTSRGGARYEQFASFDAYDRLRGNWDSLFGSEGEPLAQFDYLWPTIDQAGRLSSSNHNLQGGQVTITELISGSGKALGRLGKNSNGDWVAQGLREILSAEASSHVFGKRVLTATQIRSPFADLRDPISTVSKGGFGLNEFVSRSVEGDSKLESRTSLFIQEGALVAEELTNNARRKRTGYSSSLQKIFEVDGAGHRSSFGYDALGRVRSIKLPSGEGLELRYDALGRMAEVKSAKAGQLRFFYNSQGLVEKRVHSDLSGRSVYQESFSYDAEARIVWTRAEAQEQTRVLAYTYDGKMPDGSLVPAQLGLLSSVSSRDFAETYVYDLKARLTEQRLRIPALNLEIEKRYQRDALDRLSAVAITRALGGKTSSYEHSFEYDALGRLQARRVGSDVLNFIYNELNELQEISGAAQIAYEIDEKTSRRLGFRSESEKGLRFKMGFSAFDEVELESYQFGPRAEEVTFDYDDRGYLQNANGRSLSEAFSYSADGLMHEKVEADAVFSLEGGAAYEFDSLGRMLKRGSARLAYGATGQLESLVNEKGAFSIIYGKEKKPLLIYRDNKPYYLSWEGLTYFNGQWFEPVSVESHIVGWIQDGRFRAKNYDFRGTLIGDEPSSPYGTENLGESSVVDFAGHPYLPDLGLVAMGVRFYDPLLGQFASPDAYFMENAANCVNSPVECNLYSYARNNPLSFVDPTGNAAETPWDAYNLGLGAVSFSQNLAAGNYLGAAIDGVGLTYDTVATFIPFLPGGASTAITSVRMGGKVATSMSKVNIDTGAASAFISQNSSIRHELKGYVQGKQMVMTETAANEFASMLKAAGPEESARAQRFMSKVNIIPDSPSARAFGLLETKKVGANDKIIFGTADSLGIPTMTSDAKFLRGASAQGVDFEAFLHRPVPLRGN